MRNIRVNSVEPGETPGVTREGTGMTRKEYVSRMTTDPVQPGECTGVQPEFGRCADVQRIYGLRRGSLYNLHRRGKIKGVLLRVEGQKSGVRLWHLRSIHDLINSQMASQQQTAASN
jgi:hypothetical protein